MPRQHPLIHNPFRSGGPTRRRFLQSSAAAVAGVALANCRQNLSQVQPDGSDGTAATGGDSGGDGTLHIYTWANYIDDDLTAAFTERTGVNVIVDIYDSNEVMLTKMQAGGGAAYSLIYPSDYMVSEMIGLNLLTELDPARLEGMNTLKEKWVSPVYDPNNAHSVPFTWGTTGLLYNQTVVPSAPTDWDFLWDNQTDLSRRITLLDDVRETMGAVLRSLGYSYNTNNPDEINAAFTRLMELRPDIAAFKTNGFEDEILSGDLGVSMAYSSDAIDLTLEDDNLNYVIPASGSSLWTDTMVIPTTAPNADAAYQWINFLLEPQVAKEAVERLLFATANQAAFDLLPQEIKDNQKLYPPEAVLANCEGIAAVEEATSDLFDQYWTQITSA
ncbi:MAG: spermidine/putrescine ABC transporter substrate-binding protein [Nodosilinea sp.]